ncbi:D-ribose pyranase [Paenibacillus crassostreae]|uniref:D-ribose pyranase n=1 Tax=Paenibacillus crassostreae TaxID=1763538 RepID=A0A167DUE2_9BACL|nr:D-ribose pyranase [Paenibacillus crassostreae]AOZ91048.1 D-ribose pyranase [Paenibacillus crassostreae]OAB74789.1 ribose ABC transporter [Paenibacillus crassostreae]
MKKQGILNSHISKILADLGHTDTIVIADVGLPIPAWVPKIDLALKLGVPSFQDVVDIIIEDMVIEKVIVAEELDTENQKTSQYINNQFNGILIEKLSHEQFKLLTHKAKVIIRTGEASPYANCILQAGVNFG